MIKIEITLNEESGSINLQHNASNTIVVYGMIEAAKDIIQKTQADRERLIQPAHVINPINKLS